MVDWPGRGSRGRRTEREPRRDGTEAQYLKKASIYYRNTEVVTKFSSYTESEDFSVEARTNSKTSKQVNLLLGSNPFEFKDDIHRRTSQNRKREFSDGGHTFTEVTPRTKFIPSGYTLFQRVIGESTWKRIGTKLYQSEKEATQAYSFRLTNLPTSVERTIKKV